LGRTISIPQRDLSDLKAQLNSVGWFIPPFVSVDFIQMTLRLKAMTGNGPFTEADLEEMLASLYGPSHLARMVLHRYPLMPVLQFYVQTIAESVWAHFAGLPHVAVCGLMPVVEGVGRGLAVARGLSSDGSLKATFQRLHASVTEDVMRRNIGATTEITVMTESFHRFIESYFYIRSEQYPFFDGTNRHGVLHGSFTDTSYGRPLNFFKTIAAIDFLSLIASLSTSRISGFTPDPTPESNALAARYFALDGLYTTAAESSPGAPQSL
jgi:hypothetical protein